MKIRLLLLSLPLCLAGCVDPNTGLSGSSSHPLGSRSTASISYAQSESGFEMVDSTNFFNSLFNKNLNKSEFETQAQYEGRLQAIQSGTALTFLKVDVSLIQYVYNAENQTLAVMLPPHPLAGSDLSGTKYGFSPYAASRFTIAETIHDLGKKPMQNSFGATTDVQSYYSYRYDVNLSNFLQLPVNLRWRKNPQDPEVCVGLPVPLSGVEAEALVKSKSLTLVFGIMVGSVRDVGHYGDAKSATIDSPVEFGEDTKELPARLVKLCVLNTATGRIIATWSQDVES